MRYLADERLRQPAVAQRLQALLRNVEQCYERTGWMPDIGGRVYVPGELYNIRRTDNLVLGVDGRWWLVDVGATELFHNRTWPTGRFHARLMLRALRRFSVDLDSFASLGTGKQGHTQGRWSAHAAR